MQITGCKSAENIIDVLTIIIDKLKNSKYKYVIENIEECDINKIYDLKIALINSDFNIGFIIDLQNLHNILPKEVDRIFNMSRHTCVNIKYILKEENKKEKKVSNFVFRKGSIIITGSNNCEQLKQSYEYINKLLLQHYIDIVDRQDIYQKVINDYLKIS